MSDDPVFVYAAIYADRADADADYEALLDLHSADLVGSYDVALVYKDDEGKVHVTKHEKPTQHGAWTGAAVGALVGIIFPPAVLGAAVVGAAAGGGSDMPWVACRAVTPRSSARSSTRARPRWS